MSIRLCAHTWGVSWHGVRWKKRGIARVTDRVSIPWGKYYTDQHRAIWKRSAEAQQVRPVHRADQIEEHLECRIRDRLFAREREGADLVVVPVHVVLMVMVVRIGLRGEPALAAYPLPPGA